MPVLRLRSAFLRWLHNANCDERGQTLLLVVVVMLALMGMAAMALDVGQILWSRGMEQNVADAAALAGVRALPLPKASTDPNNNAAVDLAKSYAAQNYPAGEAITVNAHVESVRSATAYDVIVVDISRAVQPGLRAAVGSVAPIDVPAHAEAIVTTVEPKCSIFPFVIQKTISPEGMPPIDYDNPAIYGKKVTLKIGAPGASAEGETPSPGNFGLLDIAGTGKDGLPKVISDGGGCIADPDSPLETLTGGKIGQIKEGFWGSPGGPDPLPGLIYHTNPDPWPACPPTDGVVDLSDPLRPISCTTVTGHGKVPDNVYWEVDNPNNPAPAPPSGPEVPWGLGSPSPDPDTVPPYYSGCNGPSAAGDYPAVQIGSCPRVGFVPVIANGSWPTGGSTEVTPIGWAAFYIIGTTNSGGGLSVIGSFLEKVSISGGTPSWGDPDGAPLVGYFLWK